MYRLTDQQIDYIFDDISARGVKMESLQHNLLDHVCCIIERDLEPGGDFEKFYSSVITTFYKNDLHEIETETINLLTYKNYYAMRKILIASGLISALGFIAGSTFKIMHWPGASVLLVLGAACLSLLFLPLLLILKSKEANSFTDKVLVTTGVLIGFLYCIAVLFAVMHWPGGRSGIFWISIFVVSIFVFIPTYFFTGIRKPETKANTIVTSVILVGVTCLQFTMVNLRPVAQGEVKMFNYLQSEELLKKMQHQSGDTAVPDKAVADINSTCEKLKHLILANATATTSTDETLDLKRVALADENLGNDFYEQGSGTRLLIYLKNQVAEYNQSTDEAHKIPVDNSILNLDFKKFGSYSNLLMLNSITQLQMYLVNAENKTANNTIPKKKEG